MLSPKAADRDSASSAISGSRLRGGRFSSPLEGRHAGALRRRLGLEGDASTARSARSSSALRSSSDARSARSVLGRSGRGSTYLGAESVTRQATDRISPIVGRGARGVPLAEKRTTIDSSAARSTRQTTSILRNRGARGVPLAEPRITARGGATATAGSSIIRPSGVPTLRRSAPITSRYYPLYRHHRRHRHHGHIAVGLHFGYPYYSHYGYGSSLYVTYPYVGYYHHYRWPYLHHYGYGHCGFYSGFYIRFGYHRASYFSACSGFGWHASHHHHHHVYYCSAHGYHRYHRRDCSICYPYGGSYVIHDVDVPPVESYEETEVVVEDAGGASAGEERLETEAEAVEPVESEELFFASLRPAQLSFALGFVHFREGRYRESTEAFYNATLEDPDSRVAKLFLASSLYAIGEYDHAASYLKIALHEWERFPRYRWDFRALYGPDGESEAHAARLEEHLDVHPRDQEAHLVRAFVRFSSGDAAGAAPSFDLLRTEGEDPRVWGIARSFIAEIEARASGEGASRPPESETDPVARFLETLSLEHLKALEMK